jgi:hypothetical protein
MKLATPDAEEANSDRRQDATLDKPRRNVPGVQQVIELEEKAKAQQEDELPYRPCSRKPVKPRGDCAHRDCLEISINLSPAYGPLVLPLFVFCAYPVFWQRNRTSHAARCVTHELTIRAW